MIDITYTVPEGKLIPPGAANIPLAILQDDRHMNCLIDSACDHIANISII